MLKKENKRILFTGSTGFPFGSAVVQRQIQLANALSEAGYDVLVINKRGTHPKKITKRESIKTKGRFNQIDYVHTSLLSYKPKSFFSRNFFKLIGVFNEFFFIIYCKCFKNAKYLFNNSVKINELRYYYFIAKLLNMQLIYDYVELVSSLKNREEKVVIDNKSFDNLFLKHTDKVITISSFLETYLVNRGNKRPTIKIPPIIDFSLITSIKEKEKTNNFFLFCGSAGYLDVIKFVINSYKNSLSVKNDYELRLIVNGSETDIERIDTYIDSLELSDKITILSKLPYKELLLNYKQASALLIPIQNNLQDEARFPFKICEYVASKRPIITSDFGAVNEFFKDEVNAYVAKSGDVNDFTSKLNAVIDNPVKADNIGMKGYELGYKTFNYKSYSSKLKEFLETKL